MKIELSKLIEMKELALGDLITRFEKKHMDSEEKAAFVALVQKEQELEHNERKFFFEKNKR